MKSALFHPEINGEEVEVSAISFVCTNCQSSLMDSNQMNALRRAAKETYRKRHPIA